MKIFDGELKLISKVVVTNNLLYLRFSVFPENFEFHAGQFLSLNFGGNKWRAYSIASSPKKKIIEFTVRLLPNGVASEIFKKSEIGDKFTFKGPFSNFRVSENKNQDIVFCATGTGIAPIRSMILGMGETKKTKLFYGGRNQEELPYLEEINKWANENFKIFLGLSQKLITTNWENKKFITAEKCRITKFLEEQDFEEDCEFYICGNGKMVQSVCNILTKKNIKSKKIFFERFN
jgi:NAD(P)H-flavin reductase